MMQALIKLISLHIVVAIFGAPLVALLGGLKIWKMRKKHRLFPHMAMVKFGLFVGLECFAMSLIDPSSPGFQMKLQGWQGWWFLGGEAAILLPLSGLVFYLVGLKNGDAK